jgi:predicted permease
MRGDVLDELRLTFRLFGRQPLFTAIALATLAVGIGATTAVSGAAKALLLRAPGGLDQPDRVVEIGRTSRNGGFDSFSYLELQDMQAATGPLEAVAGWRQASLSMSTPTGGRRVEAMLVSQQYFGVMGVEPARGRFFTAEEDRRPGRAVAVVSQRFWQTRLSGAPNVVGATVVLNRQPFTIVGIMPDAFRGHYPFMPPDLYLPLSMMPVASPGFDEFDQRNASWLIAVGRLAPGATREAANDALRALFARLGETYPELYGEGRRFARVSPIRMVPTPLRTAAAAFIGLLGGLVALVLVITAANVGGMLLARAAGREREVAIRLALGAGRGRIVRQLLVEAGALFVIGGAAGVVLAWWSTGLISTLQLPGEAAFQLDLRPDASVLTFGLAVALGTGLLFGLAPALQAARSSVAATLKNEGSRVTTRPGRTRRLFVTAQVALSLALLVSAGLFLRSLQRAAAIPTGFDPEGVRLISYDLSIDGYDEERGRAFNERLLAAVRALPGVSSAGVAIDLPLDLSSNGRPVYPAAWADRGEAAGLSSDFNIVSDGYTAAVGIRVLRGRSFTASDRATTERVALVSRSFAERVWPDRDPIGQRLGFNRGEADVTVVGVVADVKNQTLSESATPMIYTPVSQLYRSDLTLVVRSMSPAAEVTDAMRRTMLSLDPQLSLTPAQSLEEFTKLGALPQRIAAALTSSLGILAMLLCGLGLYGVIAFQVAQRTREIGVRMALGARSRDVSRLVVRRAVGLALPGAALGLAAGAAIGRLAQSFLLGVAPLDPVSLLAATGALLAVVGLAALVPAVRAAAVEPVRALRAE